MSALVDTSIMVEDMSFFYPEGFVDRSRMFFERFVYVNVFHESGVSRHVKFRQGYVAVGGECSADVDVRVTNRVSRYVQIRQAVHCSRRINGVCDYMESATFMLVSASTFPHTTFPMVCVFVAHEMSVAYRTC
jgi:hypothetical protein